MGVNSLPNGDCDLNPGPSAPESSTLTTRLPSHPVNKHRHMKQVCVQLPESAVNVTRLAFAAERRAAAPLCLGARGDRRCRSISPARTALSSKPAACRGCGRVTGQTDRQADGQADGRTLDRFIDAAPYAMPAVSTEQQ